MSVHALSTPIIVTGGAGFVGRSVIERLINDGNEVHVFVRPTSDIWRIIDIQDQCKIHLIDIIDAPLVRAAMKTIKPDVVVHLATHGAYAHQSDARAILETNITGSLNLFEAAKLAGVKLVVNAGSSSEYGPKSKPMSEFDRLGPDRVYGVAKAAQSLLASALSSNSPGETAIVSCRLFTCFGPWENGDRIVPKLVLKALANEPLELSSPNISRDFIYIDDVVDALLDFDELAQYPGEVFNIGTGVQSTLLDLVDLTLSLTRSCSEVYWGKFPTHPWDAVTWVADMARVNEKLDWKTKYTLSSGLSAFIDWVLANGGYMQEAINSAKVSECVSLAQSIRLWSVEQSFKSKVGHVGSILSIADIIAAVWAGAMTMPGSLDSGRDRLILGKGHAALALYCALRWSGLLSQEKFQTYCQDGSNVGGHPLHTLNGIELSTGSLGQGLSVACGIAYGHRIRRQQNRVFTVISDGECNEGQIWEAAMFAGHHGLHNLTVVVDRNESQCMGKTGGIVDLPNHADAWRAFGWQADDVDGHNIDELLTSLSHKTGSAPRVLIAHTVIGKGVSFMEGNFEWHYRNLSDDQASHALRELRMGVGDFNA